MRERALQSTSLNFNAKANPITSSSGKIRVINTNKEIVRITLHKLNIFNIHRVIKANAATKNIRKHKQKITQSNEQLITRRLGVIKLIHFIL
jgi:hypothetical protein